MKILFVVCFLLVACYGDDTYDTSKYKNIDVDAILANDRLVNNYFNCLMGKGSCTPDGEALKKILPDAIRTGCSKCSEEQIKVARKVSDKLRKDHKDIWDKLSDKYDPEGTYRLKYKKELIEAGFMD